MTEVIKKQDVGLFCGFSCTYFTVFAGEM